MNALAERGLQGVRAGGTLTEQTDIPRTVR